MAKNRVFKLGIGGIIISVVSDNTIPAATADEAHRPFLSNGRPEIILRVHYGSLPRRRLDEKYFDTKTNWKMFRSGDEYVLKVSRLMVVMKPDFQSGNIFIRRRDASSVFPLSYPLGEVMLINFLSKGRGAVVHACGIRYNKKGWLFVGSSQAGKSTTADLWKKGKDATVLSDDRIIIRRRGNRFWIYGTPWHGDAKARSPEKVPLEKIFFLKHAEKNAVRKINPIEAVSRLITCSFPTFWDKTGMEFTLMFCSELVKKIPCYELSFLPDKSVLSFVKSVV